MAFFGSLHLEEYYPQFISVDLLALTISAGRRWPKPPTHYIWNYNPMSSLDYRDSNPTAETQQVVAKHIIADDVIVVAFLEINRGLRSTYKKKLADNQARYYAD